MLGFGTLYGDGHDFDRAAHLETFPDTQVNALVGLRAMISKSQALGVATVTGPDVAWLASTLTREVDTTVIANLGSCWP